MSSADSTSAPAKTRAQRKTAAPALTVVSTGAASDPSLTSFSTSTLLPSVPEVPPDSTSSVAEGKGDEEAEEASDDEAGTTTTGGTTTVSTGTPAMPPPATPGPPWSAAGATHSHFASGTPIHMASFAGASSPATLSYGVGGAGAGTASTGSYSLGGAILPPCVFTIEFLMANTAFLIHGTPVCCMNCTAPLFNHSRAVGSGSVSTSSSGAFPSGKVAVSSAATIKYTELQKLTSLFATLQWTPSTVCRTLLKTLKLHMITQNVAESEWPRSLMMVMSSYPSHMEWVHANIVVPGLPWKRATVVFTERFEAKDRMVSLLRELHAFSQKAGESIQAYSERYLELLADLGRPGGLDDIFLFTRGLSGGMYRQYLLKVEMRTEFDPEFMVASVQQCADILLKLDVLNKTVNDKVSHSATHTTGDSSSGTGALKRQREAPKTPVATPQQVRIPRTPAVQGKYPVGSCTNHPTLTSHTTAECSLNANAKKSGPTPFFATPGATPASGNHNSKAHVKCFKCSKTGHYANKCPEAARPNTPQMGGAGGIAAATGSLTIEPAGGISFYTMPDEIFDGSIDLHLLTVTGTLVPVSGSSSSHNGQQVMHEAREVYVPVTPHGAVPVMIEVKGRSIPVIVDSGADISVVPASLAKELSLSVIPTTGTCRMANGAISARLGKTSPLLFTLTSTNGNFRPKFGQHQFEVMNRGKETEIILGRDLTHFLFPDGLPEPILPPVKPSLLNTSTKVFLNAQDYHQAGGTVPAGINTLGTNPDPEFLDKDYSSYEMGFLFSDEEKGTGVTCETVYVPRAGINHLTLVGSDELPHDSLGPEPGPTGMEILDDPRLAEEYARKRAQLLSYQPLKEALASNASITGFCNLPEAVIHFTIDPTKKDKLYRSQYRMPPAHKAAADKIIARWRTTGKIVVAPNNPYNSPILVVPKRDDLGGMTAFRVCLDVRELNGAVLQSYQFTFPMIREGLSHFQGCSIFGELDLEEMYLQFPLSKESQPLTSFTWDGVKYMFVGCPFGLSFLPAFAQGLMGNLVNGLSFTFAYLDNLPIGSKTWEEHLEHALLLVDRLNQANLKIKPSSIKLGFSQIKCLGHTISKLGVGIDPAKLEALRQWPLPVDGPALMSFLGFATFLREHVRHFAELTGPLEAIKNQKGPIVWTENLKSHFTLTVRAICESPFLQSPDFTRPFNIATDASNTGIGAVLYQPAQNTFDITATNIVAIFSKKLGGSQCNYSAYKKELYALKSALEHFNAYVYTTMGLVIYTDHKPLTYILDPKSAAPNEVLARWLDVILKYSCEIRHRPGVLNVMPDTLSRMFTELYSRSKTWGVVPSGTIDSVLTKLGVADSSCNPPPTQVRALTVQVPAHIADNSLGVWIRQSLIREAGDGAFAAKSFAGPPSNTGRKEIGEFITNYGGNIVTVCPADQEYVIFISDGVWLDGSIPTPRDGTELGRYINRPHGRYKANCRFVVNAGMQTVRVCTTRRIEEGEEFFAPYGRRKNVDVPAVRSLTTILCGTTGTMLYPPGGVGLAESLEAPECAIPVVDGSVYSLDVSAATAGTASTSPDNDTKFQLEQLELEKRDKKYLAPEARIPFLEREHLMGHFGRDAIYAKVFTGHGFWWPGMRTDIESVLQNCDACLKHNVTKRGFHPAQSIDATGPWSHIQIDLCTFAHQKKGDSRVLLVCIDVFTGFVFLEALPNQEGTTIAHQLFKWFCVFGFPQILQSDNGREFVNEVLRALVQISGIDHRLIAPYNPRTDGKVERAVGTVKGRIMRMLHGNLHDWQLFVPFVQYCINTKICALTNSTPFSLMFARHPGLFKDYVDSTGTTTTGTGTTDTNRSILMKDWKSYQEKVISLVLPAVAEGMKPKKASMIKRMDETRRQLTADAFPKGAIVYLRDPTILDKFSGKYIGPYTVTRRTRWGSYQLMDSRKDPLDRVVPGDQLKLVTKAPRKQDLESEFHQVEKVVDHYGTKGDWTYLVQWKGYPLKEWIPQANFEDTECIREYWDSTSLTAATAGAKPAPIDHTTDPTGPILPTPRLVKAKKTTQIVVEKEAAYTASTQPTPGAPVTGTTSGTTGTARTSSSSSITGAIPVLPVPVPAAAGTRTSPRTTGSQPVALRVPLAAPGTIRTRHTRGPSKKAHKPIAKVGLITFYFSLSTIKPSANHGSEPTQQ